MKHEEVMFHRPAKLLQVFRMVNVYGKDEKSFADRKDKLVWKEFLSRSGYVDDDRVYLPQAIVEDKKFGNCQLITIEDEADITPQHEWKYINKRYHRGNNHCFNLHHSNTYECFGFANDPLKLSLRWNYFAVGDPTRENFIITTLEKNVPVEVKINGKLDTSYGRYYKEQYYIFHYLGDFDRCFLLKENDAAVKKAVPDQRKEISLIKPLW